MTPPIDALIDILNQEAALYGKMAELLQDEKAAAIATRLEGLHAARTEKERLIAGIGQLERRRLELATAINRDWFDAQGPVALKDLIRRLDPDAAGRLWRCREHLLATIARVSDMNTENASLLAHSRKWVTGAMRLLDHLFNPQAVYQRSGRFSRQGRTGSVLNGTY